MVDYFTVYGTEWAECIVAQDEEIVPMMSLPRRFQLNAGKTDLVRITYESEITIDKNWCRDCQAICCVRDLGFYFDHSSVWIEITHQHRRQNLFLSPTTASTYSLTTQIRSHCRTCSGVSHVQLNGRISRLSDSCSAAVFCCNCSMLFLSLMCVYAQLPVSDSKIQVCTNDVRHFIVDSCS